MNQFSTQKHAIDSLIRFYHRAGLIDQPDPAKMLIGPIQSRLDSEGLEESDLGHVQRGVDINLAMAVVNFPGATEEAQTGLAYALAAEEFSIKGQIMSLARLRPVPTYDGAPLMQSYCIVAQIEDRLAAYAVVGRDVWLRTVNGMPDEARVALARKMQHVIHMKTSQAIARLQLFEARPINGITVTKDIEGMGVSVVHYKRSPSGDSGDEG